MFISKRAFKAAIDNAIRETEEKCWKSYDMDMTRRYEGERFEKMNERLRKVEEACGLVTPTVTCPCGVTIHSNAKI